MPSQPQTDMLSTSKIDLALNSTQNKAEDAERGEKN